MKLIADSGSTKTSWLLMFDTVAPSFMFQTVGINPVRDDDSFIKEVIQEAQRTIEAECLAGRAATLSSHAEVSEVYFYGAGCIPPYSLTLQTLLQEAFPAATVVVESDLLGAARALCCHHEGIACILGTGSNSCLYDGERIVHNTPALGWILGDEGSGAVLGRTLVSDVLKGQLPKALCADFLATYQLTAASIIEAVYRQPQPNRFLASLAPFASRHREVPEMHQLLVEHFRRFLRRNVAAYGRKDLPVNCVGSIAAYFAEELHVAAEMEGFVIGKIEKAPILLLGAFHQ